jgi:predicted  nucleic acid-binding Zn-ribbon protein
MTELADVEGRIAAALRRIGAGVEAMTGHGAAAPPEAPPDIAAVQAELDEVRAANADLTERNTALRRRMRKQVAALEERVARLTEQADSRGLDLQRLRRANDELIAANRALLEAQADPSALPGAINRVLMSELEALRAARRAESDEVDTVMAELDRLVDVRSLGVAKAGGEVPAEEVAKEGPGRA